MPREVEEWRQSVRDPFDRALDTIEPSPYAPKWVRAAHDAKRTDDSAAFELDEPSPLGAPPARTNTSEGIVIDRIRIPRSLEPTLMPPPAFESRSFLRLSLVFGVAVGIATVAAFVLVGKPWSGKTSSAETAKVLPVAYTETAPARVERNARLYPKLIVVDVIPHQPGETVPIGISIEDAIEGSVAIIRGIPQNVTLSAGERRTDGSWLIPSGELEHAVIAPPGGFAGAMDLSLELRLPDNRLADRRAIHIEWPRPVVAEVQPPEVRPNDVRAAAVRPAGLAGGGELQPREQKPPASLPKPTAPILHRLDPQEIASLLNRGHELIGSGDLGAARLVLQRAAEAGDARAALALAGTYDPSVLETLPIHGFVPNVALARHWYEKAQEFGSPDAPQRLQMLASRKD